VCAPGTLVPEILSAKQQSNCGKEWSGAKTFLQNVDRQKFALLP